MPTRANLPYAKTLPDTPIKTEDTSQVVARKTSTGNGIPPVIPSQRLLSNRPPRDSSLPRSVARRLEPPKIIHPKPTSNELVPAKIGSKSLGVQRGRDEEPDDELKQPDRNHEYIAVFGAKPRIARTPDVSQLVQ